MLADATEKKQQQEAEKSKKQEREHMENDYLNRKAEFDKMEAEQHYDPVQAEINREKAEKSQQLRTQVATEKLENDDTVRFFNHVSWVTTASFFGFSSSPTSAANRNLAPSVA